MASRVTLALCIFVVSSYAGVMGREILGTPYIDHWLRNSGTPDEIKCNAAGDKVADRDNCHNYYVCNKANHVDLEVQTCTAEFDCFDPAAELAACIIDTTGTVCPRLCEGSPCSYECPAATDSKVAKEGDCNKYIECYATRDTYPITRNCTADKGGLYFNGESCGTDPSKCCGCRPVTCTTDIELRTDPDDCHKYYVCAGTSGPPTWNLPCDKPGIDAGVCTDKTKPCTNACPTGTEPTIIPSEASSSSTTTSITTTTEEITTTPTPPCINLEDFPCPAKGFYAHCPPACVNSYIRCDKTAGTPVLGYCPGVTVFNPLPEYPYCVEPGNCPYRG